MSQFPLAAEFAGKRVLITGAAGVFGRWIVESFDRAGAELFLSDLDGAALQAFAATLSRPVLTHVTDLGLEASMADLLAQVESHWGAPDILINNAGVYPSSFLLDMGLNDFDRVFDVNLRAPFYLSKGVALQMIKAGQGGNIINISSGAARKMRMTAVAYSTSKTALDRLTKGFALELAEYGIRVNIVEPGFAAGSSASPLTEAHVANVLKNIPLGRGAGPMDAPNAIMFLCSSAGAFITGTSLAVDGGNSIGSNVVTQAKKKAL